MMYQSKWLVAEGTTASNVRLLLKRLFRAGKGLPHERINKIAKSAKNHWCVRLNSTKNSIGQTLLVIKPWSWENGENYEIVATLKCLRFSNLIASNLGAGRLPTEYRSTPIPTNRLLAGEYLRIRTSNFDEGHALFLNNKRYWTQMGSGFFFF